MKRPDSINILGQAFDIRWSGLSGDDAGMFELAEQRISVKDSQGPQQIRDSLLHEVMHGILTMTGQSEFLNEKREESLCIALATGVLGALRANPELATWLMADD